MKHFKNLILLFLVTSLLFTGCAKPSGQAAPSKDGAATAGQFGPPTAKEDSSIAVEVIHIETSEAVKEYQTVGTLTVSEEINVSGNTSGTVKSVNFDVGDTVAKGDILYTLDSADLENSLNLSKSKYEKSVSDAATTLADQQENFNNTKILYEAGAASKTEYDAALTSLNQAKSNYEQTVKELDAHNYSAASSLNDTIIKSPIDGIVSSRNIEPGEMTGGTDFIIIKADPILVQTTVSEEFINSISVGDKAKVSVQDEEYTGTISRISPVGENGSNIYPVELSLSNKKNILKPGMFAKVFFEVEKIGNQILIPKKSILTDDGKNYVYIAEDDKPKKITVEKGFTQDGMVQILRGLNTGDQLIIKGQEYITEGASIRIVN
ncbi:efflux RND transporter periplasmic adaptor subunit [Petroclostridium sp. X23]|uniref:efflux RND transporter periplasmic adaptor subunit n=1 Tax=Petroclostridium sp. X23 TaxID=3045146 RepID=UPI0024ADC8C9|nr:efflux RND transporter periplasmic adaptor subunit [Petroclostridium sp. X23]WHH57967.1 efflux RND transporter periplasmic adaptor subunit [Petroclostridium sp. X23]